MGCAQEGLTKLVGQKSPAWPRREMGLQHLGSACHSWQNHECERYCGGPEQGRPGEWQQMELVLAREGAEQINGPDDGNARIIHQIGHWPPSRCDLAADFAAHDLGVDGLDAACVDGRGERQDQAGYETGYNRAGPHSRWPPKSCSLRIAVVVRPILRDVFSVPVCIRRDIKLARRADHVLKVNRLVERIFVHRRDPLQPALPTVEHL